MALKSTIPSFLKGEGGLTPKTPMPPFPVPVGLTELSKEEIEIALTIPVWDKWSLGNDNPPEKVTNAQVVARHARYPLKGFRHLSRLVLKVRGDLWYETTTGSFDAARRLYEQKRLGTVHGRGKRG
jgi:hypothetical protein